MTLDSHAVPYSPSPKPSHVVIDPSPCFRRPLTTLFRIASSLALVCGCACLLGCGTTTQRTGTEQILLSDAVDKAVAQLDFRHIAGKSVYLDDQYLETVKGALFVNAPYITSSLRQQLTAAGCRIQDNKDDADIIVEPRVGALGTNSNEIIYGIPRNNLLNSAASVIPDAPPVPAIPEISVARVDAQSGIAKILVFAYERETRQPVWQSGVARAESTVRNSWILGAGPFQKGTIHNGTRFAGQGQFEFLEPAPGVEYGQPMVFNAPLQEGVRTADEATSQPSPEESSPLKPIPR